MMRTEKRITDDLVIMTPTPGPDQTETPHDFVDTGTALELILKVEVLAEEDIIDGDAELGDGVVDVVVGFAGVSPGGAAEVVAVVDFADFVSGEVVVHEDDAAELVVGFVVCLVHADGDGLVEVEEVAAVDKAKAAEARVLRVVVENVFAQGVPGVFKVIAWVLHGIVVVLHVGGWWVRVGITNWIDNEERPIS